MIPRMLTNSLLALALASSLPATAGVDEDEAALARMIITTSGITARVAIDRALAEYPGVVYEYELEEDDDRFVHEVEIANLENNRTHKIKIDAESGETVSVESSRASSWFNGNDDVKAAHAISKSTLSLIGAVEKTAVGEDDILLEVEFKQKQGISFFKVEYMGDLGEKEILVDVETRDIIPNFGKK